MEYKLVTKKTLVRRIRRKTDGVESAGAETDKNWSEIERGRGIKEFSIMSGEAERIRNGGNGKRGKVSEQRARKQGRGSAEQFQMVSMC